MITMIKRMRWSALLLCFSLLAAPAFAIDTDGDGYDDAVDAFPNDPAAAVDTDGDGKPDVYLGTTLDSFETGNFSGGSWAQNAWKVASGDASHGTYAAVSTMVSTNTTTTNTLTLTLNVVGSVKVQYDYKFAKQATGGGKNTFTIPCDTCLYNEATATDVWLRETKTLTAGTYQLKWIHTCVATETARTGGNCSATWNGKTLGQSIAKVDNIRLVNGSTSLVEDTDDDNDGVADPSDKFPLDATESQDTDNDGIGNNADTDDDNDAVLDTVDNCVLNANTDQLNTDGDAQGNVCDSDDDNDGVADTTDKFPLNAAASSDTDLDGVPGSWNAACDATCQNNSGLVLDNCPSNANADQLNTDGDAQGDVCDGDDDNDGAQDGADNCPLVPNTNQLDSDGDGLGNACDAAPYTIYTAAQVVGGVYHSCVLTTAGAVKCWGSNFNGQLGDNTTTSRTTPVDVVGLGSGVQALVAGNSHTCALLATGAVKCWGRNDYGQLGDNTVTNRLTPVDVIGLGSGVTALAAGNSHTCALLATGAVQCWGYNAYGALGDNTVTNRLTPVDVIGLGSGVTAIAGGGYHTCALLATGAMRCWGSNSAGQLGDNTTTNRTAPVDVIGPGSGATAIEGGGNHTCALLATGAVQCWGYNYYGQLGDNTTTNHTTPVDVIGLGSGVAAITGGDNHTCALLATGAVQCWGYNSSGQLGDNTTTNHATPVDVIRLGSGATAIAGGGSHTCALLATGAVQCWGGNSAGQLGDNTTTNHVVPVYVAGFADDADKDGVIDTIDNCPNGVNQDQLDSDADGLGDICDPSTNPDDLDGDGIDNNLDNCPTTANTNQLNTDGDAQGNACDSDDDNDGVADASDKFPLDATESQDADNDGIGNNADTDDDNDTVLDAADNCPFNANTDQLNTDGDAQGNVCDSDDDNDGVADATDKFPLNAAASSDTDGDGFPGSWNAACDATCQNNSGLVLDNCPTTANTNQLNTDGDAQGNACDSDDDNDGVADASDKFPLDATESQDADNDGIGNNADTDDDNDTVLDAADNCPFNANTDQLNTDGDAQGNVCDSDDDNDGVADAADKFPLNAAASSDTDGDGFPGSWNAACDATCQNNSGLVLDNCPTQSNPDQADYNNNGIGNVCDSSNPGSLDTAFNTVLGMGPYNTVYAIAPQTDGKVLIGGAFDTVDGIARNFLTRLNSDGSLDVGFNSSAVGLNSYVRSLAIQNDGKILMGGHFTVVNGVSRGGIARLNGDGSPDTSFNDGMGADGVVYAIALQNDGKVLIGGDFTSYNGTLMNRIARLNSDGSLDASFNPGVSTSSAVQSLSLQVDGKVLVAGGFISNGTAYSSVVRLNSDGSLDTSFTPSSSSSAVMTVLSQTDGKVLIGGQFMEVNGVARNRIARLNSDGSLDDHFAPYLGNQAYAANPEDIFGYVYPIVLQADRKVLIGGGFASVNGVARNRIARLNSDGSLDASFDPGTGANGFVYSIAVQANGEMLIGGDFTAYNGTFISRIAKIHTGDSDNDAIEDAVDNCTYIANLDQLDTDLDRLGDACEGIDMDGDGIDNLADNCVALPNASQTDTDSDGVGNACDGTPNGDTDGDGIDSLTDNCPAVSNASQTDKDRDGTGDACDSDFDGDGDGIYNTVDNCPFDPNTSQSDADSDGAGNACDSDDDNDGVPDEYDSFPFDPTESVDTDNDGVGNETDNDDDNDAILDGGDNCPLIQNVSQANTDSDELGDACDPDIDGDTILNATDNCLLISNIAQTDTDVDSIGDVCDSTPNGDTDDDGVDNSSDNCVSVSNANQLDSDADGIGNACDADLDSDGDGINNGTDNCSMVANPDQADKDGDGRGDLCDVSSNGNVGIAAGSLHTCALTPGGGVKCWGANYDGQLGDNTTVQKLAPVDVVGLGSGVVAIAAAEDHTCALTTGGAVKCWGGNGSGQLGNNTTVSSSVPVDVVGLGSGVTAIAAGSAHTCAVTAGGAVKCWGGNYYGQLGDYTNVDKRIPVDVAGLGSGVTAIAAGVVHTCAVAMGGAVRCWGHNSTGKLGDNTTVDKWMPVGVVSLNSGIDTVVGGYDHTCALTVSGGMRCWGGNSGGQLGDNTTVSKSIPVDVVGLDSGVSAMAAGDYHSCALTQGGAIKCWGSNDYGQLGDNTGIGKLLPVDVVVSPGDTDADGISNAVDNCVSAPNTDQLNTDNDAEGNVCDSDDDNDGVADVSDKWPLDATESQDADNDGIGNNADTDDDNDTVLDAADNCPLNANANQLDTDGDGLGDVCDVVDSSFNAGTGPDGSVWAVALQDDGKVLVSGQFSAINGVPHNRIARLNSDGSLDASFKDPGDTGSNTRIRAMAIQADGKVFIGGNFTKVNGVTINRIARLNSDGSLDTSFNPGTGAGNEVNAMVLQNDGKLLIGGVFTTVNGVQRNYIARLNSDGSLDTGFNPGNGASGQVFALTLQADGKVLIGGVSNMSAGMVRRLNSDGSLDTSFSSGGTGANSPVYAVALQDDGKVLIGGVFTTFKGMVANHIARLNSDGSLDTSFNSVTGVDNYVYALTLQDGGKVLIGGRFTAVNGVTTNRIARLNSDGSLDTSFNPGGSGADNDVLAVALQTDGKVLIGGVFTTVNDIAHQYIARLQTVVDSDHDGIDNSSDNCIAVSNADQLNTDGDTQGNACDSTPNGDTDGDGIDNNLDNCPVVANPSQSDIDSDGAGDACDSDFDTDGDVINNSIDNCPFVANANQLNTDGDTKGDVCDSTPNGDTDGDGIDNSSDNCVSVSNASQSDIDGDGIGDACDATPNGDTDGDAVDNLSDNCPLVSNANQLNTDGDAQGNVCDNDNDNDGVPDASDAFPWNASESADADADGIGNNADNCPLVSNANQLNTDGDAQGDACDVFPDDPVTLLQQDGTAKNEHLGSSVALADMNNDGVVDLVVGSPLADVLRNGKLLKKAGKIQIVSGKNNTVIRTISGVLANQQLGAAIAVVPDQNSDGLRDIVVGDPLADVTQFRNNHLPVLKDAGRVLLYSGKDGRMLRILVEGNTAGDHFGAAVAVGDVNADNNPDLIVGAPMSDVTAKNAGQISVFNGISKTLLYTRSGHQKAEHFAAAVAVANGHLFVGSPQFDTATAKDAGRVSVFNASDNSSSALLIVEGAAKADAFGTAITAANDDWAVGIPLADSTGKNAGSVQMFSGLNTTAVKILNGAAAGDNFGSALNMQGDVNNDGMNDIAIGAARFDASTSVNGKTVLLKDVGRVDVLTGAALP